MPSPSIFLPGDAAGALNNWSVEPTGEIHANAVRDDDADTSYVFTTANLRGDLWPHDDAISTGGVPQDEGIKIDSVTSFFRGRLTAAGTRNTRAGLRFNGSNYVNTTNDVWTNTTYAIKSRVWTVNPIPGQGNVWRKEHFVPGYFQQYGLTSFNAGVEVRITEAWLEVAYSMEPRRGLRMRGKSITPVGVGRIAHG